MFTAIRDIEPGEEITVNYNGDPKDRLRSDSTVIESARTHANGRRRTPTGALGVLRRVDLSVGLFRADGPFPTTVIETIMTPGPTAAEGMTRRGSSGSLSLAFLAWAGPIAGAGGSTRRRGTTSGTAAAPEWRDSGRPPRGRGLTVRFRSGAGERGGRC